MKRCVADARNFFLPYVWTFVGDVSAPVGAGAEIDTAWGSGISRVVAGSSGLGFDVWELFDGVEEGLDGVGELDEKGKEDYGGGIHMLE